MRQKLVLCCVLGGKQNVPHGILTMTWVALDLHGLAFGSLTCAVASCMVLYFRVVLSTNREEILRHIIVVNRVKV